ncbi:MAG: hypothetical protein CMI67_10115 [Pelagibaca sp.]|uniref:sulfotransferase n=1 Tax=Salipiger bermudensis TaxID=344736 RepID=UPI000C92C2E5|nr:sulfotransferase [Salipiger bermudensis]MAE89927.1 hypothetical protein [Pelagibaca sp.]MCA1288268.1 hypothetical protein [Salipiger bermudensis]
MSDKKIFFIGLNKTGTTSLHHLLDASGVSSVHWKIPARPVFLGKTIYRNFSAGLPLLHGMDQFVGYSEFTFTNNEIHLDGTRLFRQLHAEYPTSYFILNTRDKDRWIASRANHFSDTYGMYIDRFKKCLNLPEEAVKDLWAAHYDEHLANVREFFSDKPNFLEFDIETDPPENIASLVAADFNIDPGKWSKRNTGKSLTKRREKKSFDQK